MSHAGGAPTKYDPKYCDELIELFNRELFNIEEIDVLEKGRWVKKKIKVPCLIPTLERFAINIGVTRSTLNNWGAAHPEFLEAMEKAKEMAKDILIQHTAMGNYKEKFAIFYMTNVTDLRERVVEQKEDKKLEMVISQDESEL